MATSSHRDPLFSFIDDFLSWAGQLGSGAAAGAPSGPQIALQDGGLTASRVPQATLTQHVGPASPVFADRGGAGFEAGLPAVGGSDGAEMLPSAARRAGWGRAQGARNEATPWRAPPVGTSQGFNNAAANVASPIASVPSNEPAAGLRVGVQDWPTYPARAYRTEQATSALGTLVSAGVAVHRVEDGATGIVSKIHEQPGSDAPADFAKSSMDASGAVTADGATSARVSGSASGISQTIYGEPPFFTPFNGNGATVVQAAEALDAVNPGVTGAGIKVGVISGSFNAKGYASADLGYGTVLPSQSLVHVLNDTSLLGTDDEGRAMMQVIHDIAPGASLDFCTSLGTASDIKNGIAGSDTAFADAILALAADGCKVICDDIVSPDSPWFQSGVVANAIQTVEKEGVTYVSCAGNQRSASSQGSTTFSDPAYQSAWRGTSANLYYYPNFGYTRYSDALNFGNGPFQTLTLAAGASCKLEMQWSAPWGAAPNTTNLALIVSLPDGLGGGDVLDTFNGSNYVYYAWTNADNPSTPGESVNLKDCPLVAEGLQTNGTAELLNDTGSAVSLQISIVNLGTVDPSLVEYMAIGNGNPPGGVTIAGENAGTVSGWHESPYQFAVGAVDAGNTPNFGASPPLSEYYSSGDAGTEWLYQPNGTPYSSPQPLAPVLVSGIDDINTSDVVNGTNYAGINDFFGTSCATPSVAAVAALMLQANKKLNPFDVQDLLYDSAIPMATPYVTGDGLVQADKAVAYAKGVITLDASKTVWFGTHLNDDFIGVPGSHTIYGDEGVDTVDYSPAAGSVSVNLRSGTGANGYGGTDTYHGVSIVIGSTHFNDTLVGNKSAKELVGGSGNDILDSGGGDATLTGGGGNNTFQFDTALSSTNVPTIADFARVAGNEDILRLNDKIFAALTNPSEPSYTLTASQFLAGSNPQPTTPNQHILYNTTTGALFYDPDGSGPDPMVQFATLAGHPTLTNVAIKVY